LGKKEVCLQSSETTEFKEDAAQMQTEEAEARSDEIEAVDTETSQIEARTSRKRSRENEISPEPELDTEVTSRRHPGSSEFMEMVTIAFEESTKHRRKKRRRRRGSALKFSTIRDLRLSANFLAMIPPAMFDIDENLQFGMYFTSQFSPMRISEAILQRDLNSWILFFSACSMLSGICNVNDHLDFVIASSAYPGQSEEEHNLIVEKFKPITALAAGLEAGISGIYSLAASGVTSKLPTLEEYDAKDRFHGIEDETEKALLTYLLEDYSFKMTPVDPNTGRQMRIPHMLLRLSQTRFDDSAPMSFILNQEATQLFGYTGQELTYLADMRDPYLFASNFSESASPVSLASQ
jgi:hypothetical protein